VLEIYIERPHFKCNRFPQWGELLERGKLEVNETRNCVVTDILLNIRKSAEWI